jgi:hypothetical protein
MEAPSIDTWYHTLKKPKIEAISQKGLYEGTWASDYDERQLIGALPL